jgi:hypothetical protein
MTAERAVDSAGASDQADEARAGASARAVDGATESGRAAPAETAILGARQAMAMRALVVIALACAGALLGLGSARRAEQGERESERAGALPRPRTLTRVTEASARDTTGLPAREPSRARSTPARDIAAASVEPGLLGRTDEDELRVRLGSEAVVAARKGSGGRTLAFKLSLASGIQAYLKPEQAVSSAHWYAEVAAYHLDRALGLGRVPPVVSRSIDWSSLRRAAAGDRRAAELAIGKDGRVRGALIYWLNERLVSASTPAGWENWLRFEAFGRSTVSPYQRAAAYGAALNRAHQRMLRREPPEAFYDAVPTPERPELPAELSDMIVFDFLTLNFDRFGGSNANVLLLGEGGPLIFLDNGDGFSPGPPRRHVLDTRLAPVSRFRKRTIEALRAFDMRAFSARLAREPLAPILDARALAGLAVRREIVLEHVAAQSKRYGDAVFAW